MHSNKSDSSFWRSFTSGLALRGAFLPVGTRYRSLSLAACLGITIAVSVLSSKSARADNDYVWTGLGGNLWGNSGNWLGLDGSSFAYPNGPGAIANFEGGSSQTSLLVDGGYTVGSINFGTTLGSQSYTISTQTGSDGSELHFLTLDGGGSSAAITNATSLVQTINIGLLLHSNATFSATKASGTLSFTNPENGDFTLGINIGSYNLDLTGPGTILMNRSLSGTGTITNDGSATTFLAGNGGFSGGLVNNGLLTVGNSTHSSNLGTGIITNYGTISFAGASASLASTFMNTSNTTLNFNDSSSAGNATINNSGALNFNGNASAGAATINNSSLVQFFGNASGGSGTLNNDGYMFFNDSSTTGAQIVNTSQLAFNGNSTEENSLDNNGGVVAFTGNAVANDSFVYNAGIIDFTTNAGARLTNFDNSPYGSVKFTGNSYIDTGFLYNSGEADFTDTSTVSLVNIDNGYSNSQFSGLNANMNCSSNSLLAFDTISNEANLSFSGNAKLYDAILVNTGYLTFNNNSSASTTSDSRLPGITSNDCSLITNRFQVNFNDSSTAGTARIDNFANAYFGQNSSAATALFQNENDGLLAFSGNSSAANSVITNDGGILEFKDESTADNAVVINSAHTLDQYDSDLFLILYPKGVDISKYSGGGDVSIGELSGNGEVHLGSNTLTLGGLGTNDTISGIIGQDNDYSRTATNGSLEKIGGGTLTLTGANVYTGTTTVTGGTLAAANASALGTSAVVMNSGTLDLSGVTGGFSIGDIRGSGLVAIGSNALTLGSANTDDTLAATLTDDGIKGGTGASLVKVGTGTLTLTGVNTYTGTTTVSGGALLVNSPGALGSQGLNGVVVNGGQFGFASNPNKPAGSSSNLHNNFLLGGAGSGFVVQDALDSLTLSGSLSGDSLTASGAGTLILTGSNSYTGNTFVGDASNATTLNVGDSSMGMSSSLGVNGPVTVNGTLAFNAGSSAGSAPIANNGAITFNDTSTAGNAAIANNGSLTFAGNSTAATSAISNNGSVTLNGSSTAGSATFTGSGVLTLNDNASLGNANINSGNVIFLNGSASAGSATITNSYGAVFFDGSSNGANASLTNLGTLGFTTNSLAGSAAISSQGHYGNLFFSDSASAGSATITNEGNFNFYSNATASNANITNEAYYGGDPNNGATSANLSFVDSSSAGNAMIVNNGANSQISFESNATAGSATVTNNGGTIRFDDQATADTATIINNGGTNGGSTGSGAIELSGVGNGAGGNTLSIGSLSGSGDVDLAGNTLMLGNRNTNDTISGTIRDEDAYGDNYGPGSVTKIGTGTLTLTGSNTYSGGTTINSGTVVASGTGLGTGLVTVNAGGTLNVGMAANTTNTSQPTGNLTIGSLSLATTGSGVPALTFNLAPGSTSDVLTITGTGADVFSSSGTFQLGFASASGNDLVADMFTLITFSGQTTTDNLPSLSDFLASPTGNLQSVSTGPNAFQYVQNTNGQETLVFLENGAVIRGSDSMPEPSSLGLLLLALLPVGFGRAMFRRSSRKSQSGSASVRLSETRTTRS